MCEVDVYLKSLGDPLIICKLFAIVGSDGMNKMFAWLRSSITVSAKA
jgi:hypothetical protein